METTTAVFETTAQAIHVAFVILGEEAQQDGMLRKALIGMLENLNPPAGAHRDWLEQLRGTPSETVHFGGLSSNDVRAQCSMIMVAIRTKLPKTEMWALQAKYCKTDFEDVNGKRRFAFSREKIEAINGLTDWLHPSFPSLPRAALSCIIAKLYARHKKTEISFRDLAKTFGASRMLYARAFPRIRAQLRPLEDMAIQRLQPYFEQQGIVPPNDTEIGTPLPVLREIKKLLDGM